ncbi:TAXI family TRAP transporter solute-binding subunit [Hungatella sp. L12]|uniref:TAXI family TRAP transporter solute-binding subunit n=1 Tax=Hungatella hominis TaxID=2763050 RepID=A0ABR7H3N4_9FIRM|nr:TAXI family TRAP transporter solute-binding subunit [Hungatella hominis]MBC5707745.1 TAXI family TRAP transporter solute-binding subunit [Hungatella hominis]
MKRKNTGLAMLVLAAVFMTAACSPTGVNSTTGKSGSTAAEGASSGGTHYDLTLGTAASTGTYYVVGAAIANEVNTKNPDLTVVAQTTNGGVENVNLCMSGEMDLGMTNADAAYWSSHGGGSGFYEIYAEPGNVKGVMRLYESQGHMITTANSGIETYEDLRGKTVCLGPPSSTIPAMSIAILEAYGINTDSDIKAVYYSIDEGLEKLTDGVIDATFFVASAPASGLTSASATSDLKFVDAGEEILKQVVEKYPYYTAATTKEGAYPNMNSVNTLKIYTEIIASGDVPEEAVYQFVKGALEGQPDYVDAHVACQEINAETAASAAAKLHPGAARYYRELGLID